MYAVVVVVDDYLGPLPYLSACRGSGGGGGGRSRRRKLSVREKRPYGVMLDRWLNGDGDA